MRLNNDIGKYGELLAQKYLSACGYEILLKNWRCKFGEIDLIAQKGGRIIFFEVKTRRGGSFGAPYEAVDRGKSKKILKTALKFLAENKLKSTPQIDIISIKLNMYNIVEDIEHFKNIYESK